jgi:Domain of unknown function (DUF4411)
VTLVKKYLLDANIFIEAHMRYYPFDIGPGFWDALLAHHDKKRIFSIQQVKDELDEGDDRLTQWANDTAPKTFFKKTADKAVVDWYKKIVQWVTQQPQFTAEAQAQFASVADGWLIAYAKSNGLVVVTHEKPSAQVKARVPIPNVCDEFKVEYLNTFEMLRELGVQLVLARSRR